MRPSGEKTMTDTSRTIAKKASEHTANGALSNALIDSAELRDRVEEVVSDLAKTARKNVARRSRLAQREARALYRESTRTIKRNPWRTVGMTLLTGIVAGGILIALTGRSPAAPADPVDDDA